MSRAVSFRDLYRLITIRVGSRAGVCSGAVWGRHGFRVIMRCRVPDRG